MATRGVTYGDIECILTKLGFVRMQTAGDHRVFRHEETDTIIVLPGGPDDSKLDHIHLAVVRRMLDERGVLDAEAFDGLLAQGMTTPAA